MLPCYPRIQWVGNMFFPLKHIIWRILEVDLCHFWIGLTYSNGREVHLYAIFGWFPTGCLPPPSHPTGSTRSAGIAMHRHGLGWMDIYPPTIGIQWAWGCNGTYNVPGHGDTHKLAHYINYIGKMMVKQWAWGLGDILFSDPSKKLGFLLGCWDAYEPWPLGWIYIPSLRISILRWMTLGALNGARYY